MLRINNLRNRIELVPSTKGSLHCLQASMIMTVRALTGERLTMSDAETMTGYFEGRDTWPYMMLTSLSRLGLRVRVIEIIDPNRMATNPRSEIERVYGSSEVTQAILEITDVSAESVRARACLDDPNVDFEVRTPTADDVITGIRSDEVPIVALDWGILHGSAEFEGHFVVASAASDDAIEIFDPGPPAEAGRVVDIPTFEEALHQPNPESGMVMLVSRQPDLF
jgi:hypothetical protein